MKSKWIIVALAILLTLTSCIRDDSSSSRDQNVLTFQNDSKSYSLLLPFKESKTRLLHEARSIHHEDTYEITKQLLTLSSGYFEPKDYVITEGQAISNEQYTNILKFNSADIPYGINPQQDEQFTTEEGTVVKQPILIWDMFEVDFYKGADKQNLAGMSLALTINRTITLEDGSEQKLKESDILDYTENAARKLMAYLRSLPEFKNIPIFIGIYSLEKQDSAVPGGYVSWAYFSGNSGDFSRQNEKWLILPSSQAKETIPSISAQFDIISNNVRNFLPSEQVGVIGFAQVSNNDVKVMKMVIHTTGKTYLETKGIGQFTYDLIQQRAKEFNFDILIEVKVQQKVRMVIEKKGNVVNYIEW